MLRQARRRFQEGEGGDSRGARVVKRWCLVRLATGARVGEGRLIAGGYRRTATERSVGDRRG